MEIKLLFVDDDQQICRVSTPFLRKHGYDVTVAHDGEEAIYRFQSNSYHLIILDLMLPKMEGWAVFHKIRETSDIPIIMLTARGDITDRVEGLNKGADDYIVKPFDPNELVARVNTILRRMNKAKESPGRKNILQADGLLLDAEAYEVYVHNKMVPMPRREFEVLHFLMKHPNRAFSREEIVTKVWGHDFQGEDRVVDVCITRIRERLSGSKNITWRIETIWGVGYKFKVEP